MTIYFEKIKNYCFFI